VRRMRIARLAAGALALVTGSVFQGCMAGLWQINPCGTVLSTDFCDPDQFAQIRGGFWEPNYDIDASCTIPFTCDNQFSGGGGP